MAWHGMAFTSIIALSDLYTLIRSFVAVYNIWKDREECVVKTDWDVLLAVRSSCVSGFGVCIHSSMEFF